MPAPASAATRVFFADFETLLPPPITAGTALIEGTQDVAGPGPTDGAHAGSMLRSETGNVVTITLTNLPARSWLTLDSRQRRHRFSAERAPRNGLEVQRALATVQPTPYGEVTMLKSHESQLNPGASMSTLHFARTRPLWPRVV